MDYVRFFFKARYFLKKNFAKYVLKNRGEKKNKYVDRHAQRILAFMKI